MLIATTTGWRTVHDHLMTEPQWTTYRESFGPIAPALEITQQMVDSLDALGAKGEHEPARAIPTLVNAVYKLEQVVVEQRKLLTQITHQSNGRATLAADAVVKAIKERERTHPF